MGTGDRSTTSPPPRRPARRRPSASGPGTDGRPQRDCRRAVAPRPGTAHMARTRQALPAPSRNPTDRDRCGHMPGARGLVGPVHGGGCTGPRPGPPYDPASRERTGRRPRAGPRTRRWQADTDRLHRVSTSAQSLLVSGPLPPSAVQSPHVEGSPRVLAAVLRTPQMPSDPVRAAASHATAADPFGDIAADQYPRPITRAVA